MSIKELNPQLLWKHFYALTQAPRPSGHEEKAVEYLLQFGKEFGFETIQDEIGNVIIRKPATSGMENCTGVILQSHIDMVPQKNKEKQHDFIVDPIEAFVDGDWVTANGTTLGADNGIGLAASLAIFESADLQHGALEILATIDEEAGMTGAFGLGKGILDGKILLNLDSEDEGELYIGCAGGIDANVELAYTELPVDKNTEAYKLNITGLKGGHSGLDIDSGRGNSNKLLNRFLHVAAKKFGLRISSFEGGDMRNAIPRESEAIVTVPQQDTESFIAYLDKFQQILKAELNDVEPDMKLLAEKVDMPKTVMSWSAQNTFTKLTYGFPNGVIRMSSSIKGVVETSLNLAIVKACDGKITQQALLRSSVESAKDDLVTMVENVCTLSDAKVVFDGDYPGWKPNPDSEILRQMQEVYRTKFGKIPDVKVIHAGLECGVIGSKYDGLDMISFGPTIRHPHSPDEKVHIETVSKFWDFLVETLKNIPTK